MPADPVMRARARLFLHNFEEQLFSHIADIEKETKNAGKARSAIRDSLTMIAPIFSKQSHMLGDEFSMVDVSIAPLLWRLNHYGIELPKQAAPLLKYAERLFSRPAYIEAMTPSEKAMRK